MAGFSKRDIPHLARFHGLIAKRWNVETVLFERDEDFDRMLDYFFKARYGVSDGSSVYVPVTKHEEEVERRFTVLQHCVDRDLVRAVIRLAGGDFSKVYVTLRQQDDEHGGYRRR